MKIYLDVYGCTANKSDAAIIRGLLTNHPCYSLTSDPNQADIFIILTCTVIDTTEQRMLYKIKKMNDFQKPVIISGCMASVQAEKLKTLFPSSILLPPDKVHHIISILDGKKETEENQDKYHIQKKFTRAIAQISIAEGCSSACSYCITRLARGSLKSYPKDIIKRDIMDAIKQTCVEIQLTAQDTASYGVDLGSNLGELLQYISQIPGFHRVRVGMMNPYHVLRYLSEIISGYENYHIFKFIHLPVQSGSDRILTLMNRNYTVSDFQQLVAAFRETYPSITLATDIIVGFPTETDDDFDQTIKLIEAIQPDIVNITRFSARPYTKAKTMSGRIPTQHVKQRSKQLTHLCARIFEENNTRHLGEILPITIIEQGKKKSMMGRTDTYKQVIVHKPVPLGSRVQVEIIDASPIYLVGKII